MTNLTRIKSLRAQDFGVAGLSTTDVDWLIAEVERLTADRDGLAGSMSEHALQAQRLREIDDLLAECQRHGIPGVMVSYAQLRALRAGIAGPVAEVERLTAERDRYKEWCDSVMAQKVVDAVDIGTACYAIRRQNGRVIELQDAIDEIERASVKAILRPQPLEKE